MAWRKTTSNKICPDLVSVDIYGNHSSTADGEHRYWTFDSQEGWALFVEHVARNPERFHRHVE